jgi:hypothetical protein
VRPCGLRGGSSLVGTSGNPLLTHPANPLFQRFGRHPRLAQQRGDAVAELKTVRADHDGRSSVKLPLPVIDNVIGATNGTGYKARIGGKIVIRAHIDERGTFWYADKTNELLGGYAID